MFIFHFPVHRLNNFPTLFARGSMRTAHTHTIVITFQLNMFILFFVWRHEKAHQPFRSEVKTFSLHYDIGHFYFDMSCVRAALSFLRQRCVQLLHINNNIWILHACTCM